MTAALKAIGATAHACRIGTISAVRATVPSIEQFLAALACPCMPNTSRAPEYTGADSQPADPFAEVWSGVPDPVPDELFCPVPTG